jgi:hypothetical protein
LNFGNERRWSNCEHSFAPFGCFRPAPHCCIRKEKFAEAIQTLRVDPRNPFVFFERLFPFALPTFNRRD